MRRIIFALLLSFSTAVLAQGAEPAAAKPIELRPDAPERHIVVPGDTLWGIASKFLKDPYRWPELWKMNDAQLKSPHRIYPGQVLILDTSGAEPQLKLGTVIKLEPQVRTEPISKEIPAIPPQAIEPFLTQPLIINPGEFDSSARIVATQENRVFTGPGDMLYAVGADPNVHLWNLYRPGKALVDPDNGETLGIEAIYLGNARTAGKPGDVLPLEITYLKQEIGRGDYLLPASRPEILSYLPRPPAADINARVLTLYGGVGEGGRYSIVSLTRGKRDGLEMGHVLALYRSGETVTNRFNVDREQTSNVLPDERYGLLFVFRVFERASYGLVLEASRPVKPGDRARRP
jgi:nucleoid-associated protein YgaU